MPLIWNRFLNCWKSYKFKKTPAYLWKICASISWEGQASILTRLQIWIRLRQYLALNGGSIVIATALKGGLAGKIGASHLLFLSCTSLLPLVGLILTAQLGGRSLSFQRWWRWRILSLTVQQHTLIVIYLEMKKNNMCSESAALKC